jgi:hypothetical protein
MQGHNEDPDASCADGFFNLLACDLQRNKKGDQPGSKLEPANDMISTESAMQGNDSGHHSPGGGAKAGQAVRADKDPVSLQVHASKASEEVDHDPKSVEKPADKGKELDEAAKVDTQTPHEPGRPPARGACCRCCIS